MNDRELELTLVVTSADPESIAVELEDLRSVGDHQLLPRGVHELRDVYFDTPDARLETRGWALRLRQVGGTHRVTLKGPPRAQTWGGVERLEIEDAWSRGALARVLRELRDRGVLVTEPGSSSTDEADPREALRALGFHVIQSRVTRRVLRDVVAAEGDEVFAELAIDRVDYRFDDSLARHREVEVEQKGEGGSAAVLDVRNALTSMYPNALRPYEPSKLEIGRAVEALVCRGELQPFLDARHNLLPGAYDRIESWLRRTQKAEC